MSDEAPDKTALHEVLYNLDGQLKLRRPTGPTTPTMNYVLIESTYEGDAARFGNLQNYDDRFELRKGIPLTGRIPSDAAYRMRDDYPDNIELHESLYNLDRQLVVNEKVKAFLDAEGIQHVEYLPMKVLNHKGREVKERYFIINMLPLVDCIDLEQTQYERNPLAPKKLMEVSNLTVIEEKIPADFQLFRMDQVQSAILIRRSLAEKLKAAGFRGFNIAELSEFDAA
ncbi:DUF1629 domain-containing protein [Comamonas sp. JC664]|uniref:imm11 family protein n=1 Tax=Comamonas sp. JC664 TaxID=2801917 RepID=UPI00191E39AD|nr:DUF1629 domain-containing protein [Comamonas sp. JC664]MBL0698709.1 hypothetical protein [Comamonas sp. JC664]GHG78600.1 hypothetical protein GCM10012319_29370 [Comamonas sp. KCTC 72670]